MLPGSTGKERAQRERQKVNKRNIEIERFLGRSLRTTFNLKAIDGITIYIDTDVLQADGSTRCTSLNGAMIALVKTLRHLVYETIIPDLPQVRPVAAVSVGIKGEQLLVDLNHQEDSSVDTDINIVSSEDGSIVQVQAFAEENQVPYPLFQKAIQLGIEKNFEIIKLIKQYMGG